MFRPLFVIAVFLLATHLAAADPAPKVADLIRQLESGTAGERVIAAEMLGERGPEAAEAIPALAKVVKATKLPDREASPFEPPPKAVAIDRADVARFFAARDALVRIGPKAVPALAELLSHESGMARGLIAESIGWLGADAAEAVPSLAKLLAETNPIVQIYAADALAQIGPKAEAAIPALVALLGDPKTKDPRIITPGRSSNPKDAATQALAKLGPKGIAALKEKVLPGLIEEYKSAKPTPWDGPGLAVLSILGEAAAPAIPAIKDYIRRREQGSDLDSLVPKLLKLGPEGYKALLELLADKKADRRAIIGSIGAHRAYGDKSDLTPLVPTLLLALKDEEKAVRGSAENVLSWMGENIPPEAIELLVARLGASDPPSGYTFSKIGKVAVPSLIKALKTDDATTRKNAAIVLSAIGGSSREALPLLREMAKSKDTQLAMEASTAATRISLHPTDAAVVFRLLREADPKVRVEALTRIRTLGALAAAYQPELIRLLDDEDAKIKELAVETIANLGQDAPDAVAALAKALPPPDKWGFRLRGYGTPIGPAFKPAVPALKKALSDPNEDVRDTACRLLAQIGPDAKDAVPALGDLLRVKRDSWRVPVVLAALEAIGPNAKEALPTLLTRPLPLQETLLCLAAIGPAAKDAIPALKELVMDPNPNIRVVSAYALGRIEGDVTKHRGAFARAALPPLGDLGGTPMLLILDKVAPECPELIPLAVRLFPRLTPNARGLVTASLAKYGPAAKAIVPDLVKLLEDEEGLPPHKEIAATLGAIGPDAKAALPQLRKLLDHRDLPVALTAKEAIAKIEARK